MFETAVGIVGGAVVAILTTITVEMVRRPRLRLRIAPAVDAPYPEDQPAKRGRSLTVDLVNDPLHLLFRWMSRSPALQCRGTISFHHLDGERYFKDQMPLRFAHSLQPLPMQIVLGEMHGFLVDPIRLSADSRIDVYPGESTPIDIAVKFDSEDECYGWSNLSYFSDPPWRHPDWKLPQGRYLIAVSVSSSGQKCTGLFRLLNHGGPKDFRLEPALASDKLIEQIGIG
jgi:hypothetical protein